MKVHLGGSVYAETVKDNVVKLTTETGVVVPDRAPPVIFLQPEELRELVRLGEIIGAVPSRSEGEP